MSNGNRDSDSNPDGNSNHPTQPECLTGHNEQIVTKGNVLWTIQAEHSSQSSLSVQGCTVKASTVSMAKTGCKVGTTIVTQLA